MPPDSDGTNSLARSRISRSAPSRRTSQRIVSWSPRRARTKKREISSGDSVRIGPVGVAGFGTETSSVRTRVGTPASRGISVGRSGSLTRVDYITFAAILRWGEGQPLARPALSLTDPEHRGGDRNGRHPMAQGENMHACVAANVWTLALLGDQGNDLSL